MVKPTVMQTLLGRPSQTYSFPQDKVYFSTKQELVRIATEGQGRASPPQKTSGLHDTAHLEAQNCRRHDVTIVTDETLLSVTEEDEDEGEGEDEDSEEDVFYTPNTTPRTSMGSSHAVPRVLSTKTSLSHANTSTTSISSSSLDAHSLFSIALSDSTIITSPPQSDSSRRTAAKNQAPQEVNGYTDKEWAKDVRWLVPTSPVKSTKTPGRRHTNMLSPQLPLNAQYRKKPNTPISKSFSKNTPSIMTSMSALLEEDEVQDPTSTDSPRPSVLISPPKRVVAKAQATSNLALTSASTPPKPKLHHRRSRSLGHSAAPQISSLLSSHDDRPSSRASSTHTQTSSDSQKKQTKYASSSADPYDPTSTSLPVFAPDNLPSHGTAGFTSLVLPRTPVPLSQTSHQPKGIFGTVSSNLNDTGGKVDLTRSGVAQTTMASVEVVRGLSGIPSSFGTPSKKLISLFRRGSTSSPGPPSASGRARSQSEDGGARKIHDLATDSPLSFTSYRPPPKNVLSRGVLVQIWAVGVDGIDRQLVFGSGVSGGTHNRSGSNVLREPAKFSTPPTTPPRRSNSFRSTLGRLGGGQNASAPSSPSRSNNAPTHVGTPPAGVGYIPGRSFVGRILECGWEVSEEGGRRGDWVVGLLDVRKCGALTEFVVVDRHRVHRVPHPRMDHSENPLFLPASATPGSSKAKAIAGPRPSSSRNNTNGRLSGNHNDHRPSNLPLSLEELSLLPLCGIPAYRAVRTFTFAFSSADGPSESGTSERGWNLGSIDADGPPLYKSEKARGKEKESIPMDPPRQWGGSGRRRRALVLRGHDGTGAMAVQILVKQGWRVCAHAPYACLAWEVMDSAESGERDRMRKVEDRIRAWGGEEVVFDDGEGGEDVRGAVVRVIERLCEDGDVFDAVLDTVGGKEVWEASERLLKSSGRATGNSGNSKKEKGKRTAADIGVKQFTTLVGDMPGRTIPTAGDHFKAGLRSLSFGVSGGRGEGKDGVKIGYAWVNLGQDVDWEGEGVRETLEAVLRTAVKDGVRPWVGADHGGRKERSVPFERTPEAFVDGKGSVLADGGTLVVKIVG